MDARERKIVTLARRVFLLAMVAALAGETLLDNNKAHTLVDATPFFYAWYGFFACAAIIFLSHLLGIFLKRPEGWYEGEK